MNEKEFLNYSVEDTVARLSGVVEKQFGCTLDYEPIDSITHDQSESFYTDLRKGEPVSAGDWVFFPVFAGTDLAGAARIRNRDEINKRTLTYIHSVIRMILESRLANSEHVDVLAELEQNLLSQKEGPQKSNVLQFRDFQSNPFPFSDRPINNPLNFSFMIESKNADDIFKMALEIHSRSGRFVFLPFSDLSSEALLTAEAFKNLGSMTVFIKDITALNFDQQHALVAYFKSARDKDCPQLVAGTLMNASELRKSCMILPDLWSYLSIGFLNMTQPFEIYKKENLLQFFYDSLTGRTTT